MRHQAGAQTPNLRKDEPHPMRLLSALPDLRKGNVKDALLSVQEARQIERIVHNTASTQVHLLNLLTLSEASFATDAGAQAQTRTGRGAGPEQHVS